MFGLRRALDQEVQDAKREFQECLDSTPWAPVPHSPPSDPLSELAEAIDRALYALTTISAHDVYGGTRCVAVYTDWQLAVNDVRANAGDIYEYTYALAVVESFEPNHLYGGFVRVQSWFKWDPADKRYRDCDRPERFKNVQGFGVG